MNRFSRIACLVVLVFSSLSLAGQTPPERSWQGLDDSNRAFSTSQSITFRDLLSRRGRAQSPKISIVTCSDSRLSPEITGRQNLLDVFVSRTAGNVADSFALASLEYAATRTNPTWTNLIVVIGHSHCGAIEAALKPDSPDGPGSDHLAALIARIRESITGERFENPTPAQIAVAAKANAKGVAAYLTEKSPILKTAVDAGRIGIIPAYYDLATGRLTKIP